MIQILLISFFIFCHSYGYGQVDSVPSSVDTSFNRIDEMQNGVVSHIEYKDSLVKQTLNVPAKYFKGVEIKAHKYNRRVKDKTEKTLTRLSKYEARLKPLLVKINPNLSHSLFGDHVLTFAKALENYKRGLSLPEEYKAGCDQYRDQLTTSVSYLNESKSEMNVAKKEIIKTVSKLQELDTTINNSASIEHFISIRKKQLFKEAKEHLKNNKYFKRVNKEVYYYTQSLSDYKQLFSDKSKIEDRVQSLLRDNKDFKKYFQDNSELASLFRIPSNYGTNESLQGLQTRADIKKIIQEKIASGGSNIKESLQQNINHAQSELSNLKSKINKGNKIEEMPNFKPNSQKTKTFFQRLEYGGNFQFGKRSSYLPTTADIGLSVGYKLNDKSIIGIGGSYKMGMGSFEHLKISHQGLALRSFIDWKIKKEFYLSGGYELNRNSEFKSALEFQNLNFWEPSGLIGLSKKVIFHTKFIKHVKVQCLYDLIYKASSNNQPFIFRLGYGFN